jgi:hypothetical protein
LSIDDSIVSASVLVGWPCSLFVSFHGFTCFVVAIVGLHVLLLLLLPVMVDYNRHASSLIIAFALVVALYHYSSCFNCS